MNTGFTVTASRAMRQRYHRASMMAGVLPIDGAAYDVPKQIADGGNFMHDTYVQAFGTDPARQRALSPTLQAAAPNAPAKRALGQEPTGAPNSASKRART